MEQDATDYGTPFFWENFLKRQTEQHSEELKSKGSFTYDWYLDTNKEIIEELKKYLQPNHQVRFRKLFFQLSIPR